MASDHVHSASDHPHEHPGIPLPRAAFLGTVAAGALGLVAASRLDFGLSKFAARVTPGGGALPGFRIYTVGTIPTFDPATYTLTIDGLVERPVTLSWDEVAALPGTRMTADYHCVTGWGVDDVVYEGIAAATIAELVRPQPQARFVRTISMERPYEDQLTIDQFLRDDHLFARSMQGEPIRRLHGAPLRQVMPSMYGYKGVKWVEQITFEADEVPGYWEVRGYDADAWIGRSNGIVGDASEQGGGPSDGQSQ